MSDQNTLAEERGKLVAGAQELLGRGDDLSAEELGQAEKMIADSVELREQMDKVRDLRDKAEYETRALELWRGAQLPAPNEPGSVIPAVSRESARRDEIRSIRGLVDRAGVHGRAVLDIGLAGAEVEHRMVQMGVETRDVNQAAKFGLNPAQLVDSETETRALNITTGNKGEFTVPTFTERTWYEYLLLVAGVRNAGAEVWTTGHGAPIELTTVASHYAPTGTLEKAESAEITATEPTLGQVTLNAYKYTARIDYTNELMADTAINIDGLVASSLARTIATATEMRFTNGTASSMPKGVMHSPASGSTTTTATSHAIAAGELVAMYYGLDGDILIENDTGWMMHPETYGEIIKLKDSDGRPLFQPTYYGDAPEMILGRPVHWNPYCTKIATDNAIAVVVGNMRRAYIIRQAQNVRIEASTHLRFDHQETVFIASTRMDGQVRDATALRWLKIKA